MITLGRGRRVAQAAMLALLAGLAAGCSSSSSPASNIPVPVDTAASSSAAHAATGSASAAASFVPIVEPFDPGHPARVQSAPASCGSQSSTLAIEQCYQAKTENTDAAIDAAQLAAYSSGSPSQRTAILAQDAAWLAARGPVCQAAFNTGGTIDGISIATCLLDESTARLDAVKSITPTEAKLKSTDSIDPNDISWYTTPEGSRIGEVDTQGDQTGGVIIGWIIIGGADGFVVNPKQFYYVDGSFTDPGLIEAPNPTYHRVATGVMYQFGVDYSRLRQDPNEVKGTGGYVYAPGSPVASWQ
jgi:uncharacterized protein YecT (DUF1311 family)